jgi:hypothetical protein
MFASVATPPEPGIAKPLVMPEGSLGMRRQNIYYLDVRPGLKNAAELSSQVHTCDGKMTEPELRSLALKVLETRNYINRQTNLLDAGGEFGVRTGRDVGLLLPG